MKLHLVGVACVAFMALGQSARAAEPKASPFFPFCIEWHDAKHRSLQQQAEMVKELGYDGVGHVGPLTSIAERLKTLDAVGLKLYQITIVVDITPGKPAYDPQFKNVLALAKGRDVQFDMIMSGGKPSDNSLDPRAVEVLRACPTWPTTRARNCCSTHIRAIGCRLSKTPFAWPTRLIAPTSA